MAYKVSGTTVINDDRDILNIAEVGTDLIPDTDNTRDLGSSSKAWAEIHVKNLYAENNISNINVQEFTSSGTYTPTAGTKWAYVEVFGAGGGGGGANRSGGGDVGAGTGGGAGGYTTKLIDVSGLTGDPTITIGAGGTGGLAPSTDGTAGGNSSYDDSGVGGSDTLTGNGGTGGRTFGITGANAFFGGAGGTASGGDLNVTGNPGGGAIIVAGNNLSLGGNGGSSPLGGAGLGQSNDTAGGDASANSGSGGGGGAAINSDYAGGDGADGYVRITEYY